VSSAATVLGLFETPCEVDRSTRAREVRPASPALSAVRARIAEPVAAPLVGPRPKCFCKVVVIDCPTCTKVDWNKVRPSNGDAHRARTVAARIEVRK
jgi:hypothetical protein